MNALRGSPKLRDYFLLFLLSMIFGSSFTFTNIAVREIPPLTVAAGRIFLAFLMLYPLMRLMGQRLPQAGSVWLALLGCGLFGNALPFALISWGQVQVDAGLTSIFMAVNPLATILLAHIWTHDEKLDRWKVIGVIFGLIGVVVLMGISSLGALGEDVFRQIAILCGGVCYAINSIITRKLTHLPRWATMTALMLTASICLLPFSLIIDAPWRLTPSPAALGSIAALAIGPTSFATVLILIVIGRQGATFLSQINFMVPVFGMLFGVLFLAETLPTNAYVALIIILLGIALSRFGAKGKA